MDASSPQGSIMASTINFYRYDPAVPTNFNEITGFETSKTYYIEAKSAFNIELSGAYIPPQNSAFVIPAGVITNTGSGPYTNPSKVLVGFDSNMVRIPLSSCSALINIPGISVFARDVNNPNPQTYIYWIGALYNIRQETGLTHFEPGSSYYIVNNNTYSFMISAPRLFSYLLTDDYRFIVTEAPGYSAIRVS